MTNILIVEKYQTNSYELQLKHMVLRAGSQSLKLIQEIGKEIREITKFIFFPCLVQNLLPLLHFITLVADIPTHIY